MKPVTKHFCNWLFKIQRFVGFFQKRGHILKRELLERYATKNIVPYITKLDWMHTSPASDPNTFTK